MLLARHSDQSATSSPAAGRGSTSEQWIGSVCQVGTWEQQGGALAAADGGSASCAANPAATTGMPDPSPVRTYSSQFRLQNAVAVMPHGSVYATLTDSAGQFWLFYGVQGADLSPLSPVRLHVALGVARFVRQAATIDDARRL